MTHARIRLGFAGLGWIGRHRLQSLVDAGVEPVAYLEPDAAGRQGAQQIHPAPAVEDLDDLLQQDMDGVVIATPNALHAQQSRAALESGFHVFCQKPLARREQDARRVVEAAADGDVLLGIDWSYRGATALRAIRDRVQEGAIGDCYHVDLSFHNAYGPDKAWYRDPRMAGGGCVLDLGCHLLDALQWVLPDAYQVQSARLYQRGRPSAPDDVEDHAVATLSGRRASATMACSWNVPSGGDAAIGLSFYGTDGVLRMRNLDGSYDRFIAERLHQGGVEALARPPDAWAGREAVAWAERVGQGARFDESAWGIHENVRLVEEVYACAS